MGKLKSLAVAMVLLASVSLAYLAVPDMTKPVYPKDAEVQKLALVNENMTVQMKDFQKHGVKEFAMFPSEESVSVRVIAAENTAPEVGLSVPGTLYKVIELELRHFIGSADAVFMVSKSWLAEKSLSPEEIVIYHKETDWVKKPMSIYSNDSDYVYYKASLPSFSFYALSTWVEPPPPPEPEPVVDESEEQPQVQENQEAGNQDNSVVIPYLMAGAVILFLLLCVVLYMGIRNKISFQHGGEKHENKPKKEKK